jgi:hypothetical protein
MAAMMASSSSARMPEVSQITQKKAGPFRGDPHWTARGGHGDTLKNSPLSPSRHAVAHRRARDHRGFLPSPSPAIDFDRRLERVARPTAIRHGGHRPAQEPAPRRRRGLDAVNQGSTTGRCRTRRHPLSGPGAGGGGSPRRRCARKAASSGASSASASSSRAHRRCSARARSRPRRAHRSLPGVCSSAGPPADGAGASASVSGRAGAGAAAQPLAHGLVDEATQAGPLARAESFHEIDATQPLDDIRPTSCNRCRYRCLDAVWLAAKASDGPASRASLQAGTS